MKFELKSQITPRKTIILTVVAALILIAGGAGMAQTEAERELEGRKPQQSPTPKKPKKPKKETARITPAQDNNNRRGGGRQPGGKQPEQRRQVNFDVGTANVEILVNGERKGVSDQNGKAALALTDGTHQISARRDDNELLPPTEIVVTAKEFNFDYSAAVFKAVEKVYQDKITAAENAAKVAETPAFNVEVVFRRFVDPQTTELVTLKDWEAVYDETSKQIAATGGDNIARGQQAFARGQKHLAAGEYVQAIGAFDAAVTAMPNSSAAYYGLGDAKLRTGNSNEAATAFLKATQLEKTFAAPFQQLGDIQFKLGKTREAAAYYAQAKTLGVNSPQLRLRLAEIQIKNKNCAAALVELESLKTDAPTAGVYLASSDCYLEQKKVVSAIEALREAVKLEPENAAAQYKLGEIYLEEKEYEKAKEPLERAAALDPDGKITNRKKLQEMISNVRKKLEKS